MDVQTLPQTNQERKRASLMGEETGSLIGEEGLVTSNFRVCLGFGFSGKG
jgi:hypothetical protein